MDTFATACSVWNQERIHLVLVVKKTLYVLRKHTYTYVLSPASGLFRLHQKCQNRVTITPKNQLWKRVQVPKMSTQKKKNCRSGIPKKKQNTTLSHIRVFGGSHPPPTIILYVRHHHPKMMIYGGYFWIRGSQPWEGRQSQWYHHFQNSWLRNHSKKNTSFQRPPLTGCRWCFMVENVSPVKRTSA